MNKLILTQIVKDEAHVIERMLNSIKDIVDGICIVDTGSTDNTIEIINKWGKDNNIETYVFEREFDNFENSRNYSIEKAKETFLGRDKNTYYGFWLDADEVIEIGSDFDKNKLNKDLYMFNTYINTMKYTRNELYRLDGDFKFWGPVHEFIVPIDKTAKISTGLCDGITVIVRMDGGSWKEDTHKKYKKHSSILEDYINNEDRDPRWIFYTAQSYHDSACVPNNQEENEERLRRSMKYYHERVGHTDGYHEERFYAQFRIGTIMYRLQRPFTEVKEALLKSYKIDPLRAEPFNMIIEHYQQIGDWQSAYIYSKFCYYTFHNNSPYPQRVLFLDNKLYEWKFLEYYSNSCLHMGNKEEAKRIFRELINLVNTNPKIFTQEDINRIQINSKFFN